MAVAPSVDNKDSSVLRCLVVQQAGNHWVPQATHPKGTLSPSLQRKTLTSLSAVKTKHRKPQASKKLLQAKTPPLHSLQPTLNTGEQSHSSQIEHFQHEFNNKTHVDDNANGDEKKKDD